MIKDNERVEIDTYPICSESIQELMKELLKIVNQEEVLYRKLFQIEFQSSRSKEVMVSLIYHKKLESDLKKIGSDYIINEPMSKHTTFGIGGPVDFLILPLDNSQIPDIIKSINLNKINSIFLGSGSNILVSDKGIKGAVISLKKSSKNIIGIDGFGLEINGTKKI